MVKAILVAASLLWGSVLLAQNVPSTGKATASGACAVSHSGNYDTITIKNCGIGEEQGKKVIKVLDALLKGQDSTDAKLDEILQILKMPIRITTSESIAIPAPVPGGHPRAAIKFAADDPVDRGQFEVVCDGPCSPVDVCRLPGANSTIFATVSDQEDIAEFLFMRQFPPLTQCQLTVESRDDKPVKILTVTTSKRINDLVRAAVQPYNCVWAGNAMMC
jgi:hypothetical protein